MTMSNLNARIDGIFLGNINGKWPGRPPSAIAKTAVVGCQDISEFGFIWDSQADLEHQRGLDKAVHHYPSDHYPAWISEGRIPTGTVPAVFGENIASNGMTETNVCIGDRLRLGTATVEVSQGRQPCWKISEHTGNVKMAYLFQKIGRTGWYYRVLESGQVSPGDQIVLIERHHPEWSVETVTRARLTRRV